MPSLRMAQIFDGEVVCFFEESGCPDVVLDHGGIACGLW